jgi:hypothetical protein
VGWIGEIGRAPDIDRWRPLTDDLRGGAAHLGSVMSTGGAPRDPNGLPYQFAVRSDADDQLIGLVTDPDGEPLAWVTSADGTEDIVDEVGRPALRPMPADLAEAAWEYLAREREGP